MRKLLIGLSTLLIFSTCHSFISQNPPGVTQAEFSASTTSLQAQVTAVSTGTAVDSVARAAVSVSSYTEAIARKAADSLTGDATGQLRADVDLKETIANAQLTRNTTGQLRIDVDLKETIANTQLTRNATGQIAASVSVSSATEAIARKAGDDAIWLSTSAFGTPYDDTAVKASIAVSSETEAVARRAADAAIWNSTPSYGQPITSSTARIPTVYVCASNSPQELKAIANYVCDGTNDEVEIGSACYDLSTTGGKVLFEEGTYNISVIENNSPIFLYSSTTLSGQGNGTKFVITPLDALSRRVIKLVDGCSNSTIENIYFLFDKTGAGGYLNSRGIITNLGTAFNLRIQNNTFIPMGASTGDMTPIDFNTYGVSNVWITNNYISAGGNARIINISDSSHSNFHILDNYCLSSSMFGEAKRIYFDSLNTSEIIGNILIGNNGTGLEMTNTCNDNILSNNKANGFSSIGFKILGSSHTITGNSAYNNNIQAVISIATSKEDVNSWNSDNAKLADLLLTQEATGYNYGQIVSTRLACVSYDQALTISTNSLLAQATTNANDIVVIKSTDMVQFNTGYANTTAISTTGVAVSDLKTSTAGLQAQATANTTAISTTSVVAFSVSTSAVRVGSTGNAILNTGVIDVGTQSFDLRFTTYTLDMPIALSSNTETGDFGEFESASSFTIVGVFFTSRTTAPISNITFTVQRQTNGLNLMNGSMLLTGGLTQSAVFVSTGNMIPQNGGIRVVATGRSNGIVHAVFTVYKQRGQ